MSITTAGITWGYPQASVFLVLAFIGLFVLVRAQRKRLHILQQLTSPEHQAALITSHSKVRMILKPILLTTGLFFLCLTLLHPQWGKREEVVMQEGRDLFIALDISRSMLARDVKPDRLTFAKNKIKKLVESLSCERVGLILFSGATFVQCPLTSDYSAFYMFLESVDVETISSGTTALDQAIHKALNLFKQMKERKNKLLVIVTDGEDFSSNLADVKKQAKEMGLTIFTLGVGTPDGAPIPLFDDHGHQLGVQRDAKGAIVISRLNEGILKTLSHDTGGSYSTLTPDDTDLQKLVHTVEQYEKERLEDRKVAQLEEQYPYFLVISFLCLALEWVL